MSSRVLFLGGSFAAGLGARGRPFPRLLTEALDDPPVLDLSKSSRLIDESLMMIDEIVAFAPTLAIVQHGSGESIVHPGPLANRLIERFAPATWHGVSGLAPRAYYSTDTRKRRRQHLVSSLKVAVKRILIPLSRGRSRMTPEVFDADLRELVAMLNAIDCDVVVLGLPRRDERLFPRSQVPGDRNDAIIRRISATEPRVWFVDVEAALRCWEDYLEDRLHCNAEGHRRVAVAIAATVIPLLDAADQRTSASSPRHRSRPTA
jgi:hypothetical protein